MQQALKAGVAVLVLATAACADSDPMGPSPVMLANATSEACETLTFNTTAGAADHMAVWGGTTLFGVAVSASGERYVDNHGANAGARAPRLFYSPIQTAV